MERLMSSLDEKMSAIAEQILKRPLSDEERFEIYRISDAVGMKDVQSFLHMLLVFRLHEDAMRKGFDEISALERKINETLESSIERVLGEGARKIGTDMAGYVTEGARKTLGVNGDYHFLRGQVGIVFCMSVLVTLAYWLGSANVFRSGDGAGPLETLIMLPSGWLAFICCSLYAYMWAWDHWHQVKNSLYYKGCLGVMAALLVLMIAYLLL
jgi:hypothetical protein